MKGNDRPLILSWRSYPQSQPFSVIALLVSTTREKRGWVDSRKPSLRRACDRTGRHTSDRSSYRLLVEKLSYGFHPPQRNDLVVFKAPPKLEAQNLHDDLIKRVVGLRGDMVQIRNGQTLINGKAIAEPYVKEKSNYN